MKVSIISWYQAISTRRFICISVCICIVKRRSSSFCSTEPFQDTTAKLTFHFVFRLLFGLFSIFFVYFYSYVIDFVFVFWNESEHHFLVPRFQHASAKFFKTGNCTRKDFPFPLITNKFKRQSNFVGKAQTNDLAIRNHEYQLIFVPKIFSFMIQN